MGLDGSLFVWEPGPAVAFVSGYEYEGNYTASGVQVIFPMKRRTVRPLPGLEINMRADLPLGQEICFGGRPDSIWVVYRLSSARPLPEGMLIGYETGFPDAAGVLVLEELDARPGGRVKGKLMYAKLRSVVFDQALGDIASSRNPSYLELWNWPFDLVLDQSPYQ